MFRISDFSFRIFPYDLSIQLLIIPFSALIISLLLQLLAIRIFPALKLLDFPERYGLNRSPIPYPTGILAVITFLIFFTTFFPLELREWGLIATIIILAIVSFIDDRRPQPFWLRLAIQIALCALLFATGSRIYTITNPLGGIIDLDNSWIISVPFFGSLPMWSGIFTIAWLTLTINALNWFDGIPGQVNALSIIGFMLLGFLTLLRAHQPALSLICFILMSIAIGCLLFDFPPAKVLMGDSGSMFFGLMLGLIGIYEGGKVATAFIVLAVPLFDAIIVIIRRVHNGISPFKGGRDHLHHRFLAKGWSPQAVIILMAIISGTFGTIALFLDTTGKGIAIGVLFFTMLLMNVFTRPDKVPRSRDPRSK